MDQNTRTLVVRAQSADRDAIDTLFCRYREPLRRALAKLIGPRYRQCVADSEDATHDVILRALSRIDQFEYRGDGSFLNWLLRSAEFEVLNQLRRLDAKSRRADDNATLFETATEPDAVPRAAIVGEAREKLYECLDELPPKEREVIVLRRFMQLEMDEVATELALATPGAARALLSRAQARLAGALCRRGLRSSELGGDD